MIGSTQKNKLYYIKSD